MKKHILSLGLALLIGLGEVVRENKFGSGFQSGKPGLPQRTEV